MTPKDGARWFTDADQIWPMRSYQYEITWHKAAGSASIEAIAREIRHFDRSYTDFS